MVAVQGASLAGLAAAARLARLGHDVTLHTAGLPLGGRWAPVEHDGVAVDAMPPILILPAAWRDLFKKTGRPLDPELARAGLRLVAAGPAIHRFPDGAELALPAERGAQYHCLTQRYGAAIADRWRDLLDEASDVWAAARRFGVESPALPRGAHALHALWLDRSLSDLADRMDQPHLSRILLDLRFQAGTACGRAPALVVSRLAVERTFGRWQLTDDQGAPQPASRLLELLVDRLVLRGGRVVDGPADEPAIDCLPHTPRPRWWRPRPRPALAPTVRHEAGDGPGRGLREVFDHTPDGLRISWERPLMEGRLTTTWDYGAPRRDSAWGIEARSARAVLARPPVVDGPGLRASSCSPAGPEPWAELSSAALAVYELHERLTGEDCRPTNRAFVMPRPKRAARRAEVVD